MPGVYARISKITNAKGRSEYLRSKEKQEEIVLQKDNMLHSWEEHSQFEKENQKSYKRNNEGLEVHLALPNDLYEQKEKLEEVCDEIADSIVGENKDYEYAVHWNRNRTNLHLHILFSERENNLESKPKKYKKDIWHDKNTHQLAKAGAENAILVHKKGDIQRDKYGNIKYETDIFKPKDTTFKTRRWMHENKTVVQQILKARGYDLDIITPDTPYIAQKKLYKGAGKDYIEKATLWNEFAKKYNKHVKEMITRSPNLKELYMKRKKEILAKVKEFNSKTKSISDKTIELMEMAAAGLKNFELSNQKRIEIQTDEAPSSFSIRNNQITLTIEEEPARKKNRGPER